MVSYFTVKYPIIKTYLNNVENSINIFLLVLCFMS